MIKDNILSDLKLELAKQNDDNKSKDNILSDLKLELAKQNDDNKSKICHQILN